MLKLMNIALHTYRLVMAEDGEGAAQEIEFEGFSAASAFCFAERNCGARQVEIFEDGRSLGCLQNSPAAGFWVIQNPGNC